MSHWARFGWLAGQAASGLVYEWRTTLVLAFAVPLGLAIGRPKAEQYRLVLAHVSMILAPVFLLTLGTWFECQDCSPSSVGRGARHTGAIAIANWLLPLQLVVASVLAWVSRGWRALAIAVQANILWWSFWATFIAGMSLTGDWL